MVHGPRASPLINRVYYVFFYVPCFDIFLIVPCFKARVPKILSPARLTYVPCRASYLTETCSCRAVPCHMPPNPLAIFSCMFIQLFNAGGIANDVVFLLGLIEHFLYSNPLQIPRHAQQLQHGRRTRPWHRPPGARQHQLPLPLLLEGDHRERTVGGTYAPGRHQPYDCEEKVLEGPRRLEFLANPTHGPIQNQTIPRARLTERGVKSYGPT